MYYLMIKEIEQTGMKYLCKKKLNEKKPNAHLEYRGSGVLWRRILNKHPNYTIKTTVLGLYDFEELKIQGLFYSKKFNIVESKEWANLMDEVGDGGDTSKTEGFIKYYQNKGYTPSPHKGAKTCHNPETGDIKRIFKSDELPPGYVMGSPKGRGYGPRKGITNVYHNGQRKIYVKDGDLVPEGFVKGLHYTGTTKNRIGCYDPETRKKKYLKQGEPLPAGFILGIPPTTGKCISTPFGEFKSIQACMKSLNLTRYEIQCKIDDPDTIDWNYK